jgi:hypothetical protein
MTAPHARQPQVLPRPACTPTAIRAVLAANADGDTLQRYDEDLDAAYEQAREQGDVTPLVQTVKRWWFEADAWRDPQAQREFLARIDTYRDGGPPPAEQRMSREEIRTQFGVWRVYRWELDGPAQREFADLPLAARASLAAFMDAVVIVDPVQYQRRRDERDDVSMPLRSLHFGPDGGGLVTFLVYPPDDLVLVVKIQWLGG